jgi:hypothetical protein|tara:strand:- start:74 stop:262 length:189 start_codon:yes stop_codon:yes gene_type:complete
MIADTMTLWQVEVSNEQKFANTREQAYQYAQELQSQGRNVEVYENGVLRDKLKSAEQYSLDV